MSAVQKVVFLGYLTELCIQFLESPKFELLCIGLELNNPRSEKAKEFCVGRNIKFFDASNINDNKIFIELSEDMPLVSIGAFSQKISVITLKKFHHNIFNFHPSLLPKYRGGSPIEHQILNEESNGGMTFHWIDEEFDSGKIITQKEYFIGNCQTYEDVLEGLVNLGSEILGQLLKKPIGSWGGLKMNKDNGSYFCALTPANCFVSDRTESLYLRRLLRAFGQRGWVKIKLQGKEVIVLGMIFEGRPLCYLKPQTQGKRRSLKRLKLHNITLLI